MQFGQIYLTIQTNTIQWWIIIKLKWASQGHQAKLSHSFWKVLTWMEFWTNTISYLDKYSWQLDKYNCLRAHYQTWGSQGQAKLKRSIMDKYISQFEQMNLISLIKAVARWILLKLKGKFISEEREYQKCQQVSERFTTFCWWRFLSYIQKV